MTLGHGDIHTHVANAGATSTLPKIVTNPFGQLEAEGLWTYTTGLGQVESNHLGGHLAQLSSVPVLGHEHSWATDGSPTEMTNASVGPCIS